MARTPGPTLRLNGNTWQIRFYVSQSDQGRVGKTEILRSLKTRDKREAQHRMAAATVAIQREILSLRTGNAPPASDPQSLIFHAETYRKRVDAGEMSTEDAAEWAWQDEQATLAHHGKTDPETGECIIPDTLSETITQAYRIATDPKFKTLKQWTDLRLMSAKRNRSGKTFAAKRLPLRILCEHFGPSCDPRTISGEAAAEFFDAKIAEHPTWSCSTKGNHLSQIKEFFNWLDGKLGTDGFNNPFRKQRVKQGSQGKEKSRRGFTSKELETLLLSDLPMPYLSALVVLALYSGARLDELCARTVDEVGDGGVSLRISTAKNSNSVRTVPMHPIVQPLVRVLCATSFDGFLLSGLRAGGAGNKRSHRVTYVFTQWRHALGIAGKDTVFHSFRNTFITASASAGLHREQVNQLTGHASQSEGARYMDNPEFDKLAGYMAQVTHGDRIDTLARALVAAHTGNPKRPAFMAQSLKPVPSPIAHLRERPFPTAA